MFKKFQFVAQIVGFTTMTLLAVYGLLSLLGGGVAWAAALGGTQAAAPVNPATFNYQGFLRNADGSLATGSYTITARIYDDAEAYDAEDGDLSSVTVRDGWFNAATQSSGQIRKPCSVACRATLA
jgi:hypothetical protein